jgi:hypothetical protein
MTTYEIAYKKLIKRGFYEREINTEKLQYIIRTNYKGWADLSDKSMDFIAFNVCKTW